jgi:5'-methylthioadenosine phosphorylase
LAKAEIGIIGGSGLYNMDGLTEVREERVETPFGEPSETFLLGKLEGRNVAFLARHGKGHRILPSELNFRANVYAMKKLGVTSILSVSAVGSLKKEHKPTDFVVPDQFIDRTFARNATFFGDGVVGHVAFGDPVCPIVLDTFVKACEEVGVAGKRGGTYVCMEGPQFSTYAESMTYKNLGYSVIGMTNMPEAKLAREAEICYATVAMVTDFDCWHPDHDAVTVQDIIKVLLANGEKAKNLVARLARDFPREHEPCPIGSDCALDTALITAPDARDPALMKKLDAVAGRVLGR